MIWPRDITIKIAVIFCEIMRKKERRPEKTSNGSKKGKRG
jgi:hypothetical protein